MISPSSQEAFTEAGAPVTHQWPEGTRRLWPTPAGTDGERGTKGGATELYRRRFTVPAGARAVTLWVFAEGNFAVWFDGRKVGRGPWLHRPERRTVTELRLPAQAGEHVLAVAVQHLECDLNKLVLSGEPGLIAQLRIEHADGRTEDLVSDASWRRAPESGWRKTVRRGFCLPHVEWIDAAVYPTDWETTGFDDAAWGAAECQTLRGATFPVEWFRAELPELVFAEVRVEGTPKVWRTPPEAVDLGSCDVFWMYGDRLHKEQARWTAMTPEGAGVRAMSGGGWEWDGGATGVALGWDLGALFVGALKVEVECESAGVCEVLWSERALEDGKVWTYLKGTAYADRWELAPGRQVFSPAGYSSMQHVALVFRECPGRVRVRSVVVESSHLATGLETVTARFENPRFQKIWDICHRTLVQSPQDGMTDCPSREQSVYVSDSLLAAEWLVACGGGRSLARHTMREVFLTERQGFMPASIYSAGRGSLVDFGLIAVWLLGRFVTKHDDTELARALWPRARAVIERMSGLVAVDWHEVNGGQRDGMPNREQFSTIDPCLFIDHPGMGWHNVGEPEIERRGVNTALHALLVLAERGGAVIAEKAGAVDEARAHAERAGELTERLKTRFWDAERRLYPDGLAADGTKHASASAQTNTFCLLAEVVPAEHAHELARRAAADALPGAWNGPYVHAFLLEVLARLELREEALTLIERRWGAMVDGGASCAWETFAGDHLDTWCHPWAAAPVMWLPRLTGTPIERAVRR